MNKTKVSRDIWPFIESVMIVGTETEDHRPNFLTCAWHSRVNQRPPQWGITIDRRRHSLECIKRNGTFSINYPGKELVRAVDYCGIYSGKKVDKGSIFTVWSGALGGAPMIDECFVTYELEVKNTIELATDCLVIGEIVNTYVDNRYMADGRPDFDRMESFFLTCPDFNYRTVHEHIGKAWQIGKSLEQERVS